MKKFALTCCLLASVPTVALANEGSGMQKAEEEMFKKCDADNDGYISKSEYTDEKMQMFAKYDKDSDGKLSKEEHHTMAADMHAKMKEHK